MWKKKNIANFKKIYNDSQSVTKQGAISKVEKTIGIRISNQWSQLIFRWSWEFEKLLHDKVCYALLSENNLEIVTCYNDLQLTDYRLLPSPTWDDFHDVEEDPNLPKSYANKKIVVNK